MDNIEIRNIVNNIDIPTNLAAEEYNPMEVFVDRVREKEICHTAIIADLLNPYGKHRMSRIFLDSFLDYLKIKKYNDVIIIKERSIKSCRQDMGRRRIDICIELTDGETKYAIIIENKINNAEEQIEQITDYKKGLKKEGYIVLKTVCIQGVSGKNIGADVDISPRKLSSILKVCAHQNHNIKSYITLLENMDRKTEFSDTAKNILKMKDCEIDKIRTIAFSFYEIPKQVSLKIIDCLNKKHFHFSELKKKGANKGDIYDIVSDNHLQLWNEESYKEGHNKGFWIEVWFYDFDRFEIWIRQDEDKNISLNLKNYTKSKKYEWYYVDKTANINSESEAKKFDFPDEKQFTKLVDYVSNLYRELYKIGNV